VNTSGEGHESKSGVANGIEVVQWDAVGAKIDDQT